MSVRTSTNMTAIPMQDLPRDKNRMYLAVFATVDTEVIISGGTPFTILADTQWGPQPAPMNDIEFNGAGTIILG